jgi:hypothetical protein
VVAHPADRSVEHRVGEAVDLFQRCDGWVKEQPVESQIAVGTNRLACVFWGGEHVGDVEFGVLGGKPVVAADVPAPGIGVIAHGEVHTGVELGVAGTAGLEPRTSNAIGEGRLRVVIAQGTGDPAVSKRCHPPDRCVGGAAEYNRDLHWRSANGTALSGRFASPGVVHQRHFVVQQPAAGAEVDARSDVVVLAAAGRDADGKSIVRGVGEAGELLGEDAGGYSGASRMLVCSARLLLTPAASASAMIESKLG